MKNSIKYTFYVLHPTEIYFYERILYAIELQINASGHAYEIIQT